MPSDSAFLEPTPEALAERLLDIGDPDAALEVLDRALRRDPGSDRARALRSRAHLFKRNEHALTPRPSAVDDINEELAEAFIQRGFLEEAQIVYRRVLLYRRHGAHAGRRAELLGRVLSFHAPPEADPRQRRAEDLVAVGRLASALAEYRVLARDLPDDAAVVGRANDLRMLVLGRDAPQRRTLAHADLTTAVGASPRAAASMLEEGKLEDALVELQRLAMARPELTIFSEAAQSLDRLIQATSSDDSRQGVASPALPTRPVRQVSFVEMHIRLGNLAAAAELCRGIVETSPGDEVTRRRLEDLRTVMRFIVQARDRRAVGQTVRGKSTSGPGSPAPDVPLRKASRSQDFSGYRPSTEPGVVKSQPFRADEDVTAVVRPEEQAELYLRQGFFDKAAEIYRMLVVRHPTHLRFQERLLYIERKVRERDGPPAGPSVMELDGGAADVEVTPSDAAAPPDDEVGLGPHDRPTSLADELEPETGSEAEAEAEPEPDSQEMVFPSPTTESVPVVSAVRMRPRRPGALASDPMAEADEKTPISSPVFEDQPTGRDPLADSRLPLRPVPRSPSAGPGRATPTAPASPAIMMEEAAPADRLEASPTTALPAIRKGPLPGLVRDSIEVDGAPADFEADPLVPTAPARWSEVERLVAESRTSEPALAADDAVVDAHSVPPASTFDDGGPVTYEDQDDGIVAYDEDGFGTPRPALEPEDEPEPAPEPEPRAFEEHTPPDGTPTLQPPQAGASEPAGSQLATIAMPQMTLPITPVAPEDGAVTMRRIIVVEPKAPRRR